MPLVHYLTAPTYLFDSLDTPDKVMNTVRQYRKGDYITEEDVASPKDPNIRSPPDSVGPGQNAVTLTPVSHSSLDKASENDRT